MDPYAGYNYFPPIADIYNPDFLNDRVFRGVWQLFEKPGFSRQILTLSSYEALFVMAALLILIEYTGSRLWVIFRFIVYNARKPVHMNGTGDDPLLHLSRGHALVNTFTLAEKTARWLVRLKGRSELSEPNLQHDPAQSPWFGIAALVNISIFLILGISLPIALTDGTFGAPIVKSRPMRPVNESKVYRFVTYAGSLTKADSIFTMCDNKLYESCFRDYYFSTPNIVKRRLDQCPFPGPIWDGRTKPLEITHFNISAYELGINSPSKLRMSHRATCVPVEAEKFLIWDKNKTRSWVSARTTLDSISLKNNYAIELRTLNGPNILSNRSSGREAGRSRGITDGSVLPTVDGTIIVGEAEGPEYLHQHLRRDDGRAFLIVHRAGLTVYDRTVDDPFFAAHNEVGSIFPNNGSGYLPDYEATTMACLDQWQYCVAGKSKIHCTEWGNGTNILTYLLVLFLLNDDIVPFKDTDVDYDARMNSVLMDTDVQAIVMEALGIMDQATDTISLHQSLALRNRMLPRSALLRDQLNPQHTLYGDDEWSKEVEVWFLKAYLDMILRARLGATHPVYPGIGPRILDIVGSNAIEDWSTSGRVLFRNGNYTNINWIGFCAVMGGAIFICLTSYQIERIFDLGGRIPGAAVHQARILKIKIPFLRQQVSSMLPGPRRPLWLPILTQLDPGTWRHSNQRREQRARTHPESDPTTHRPSAADLEQGIDEIDLTDLRRGDEYEDPL